MNDDLNIREVHTRRQWLEQQGIGVAATVLYQWSRPSHAEKRTARVAAQSVRLDLEPWQALAKRAVEAAINAGAKYAEARLTRLVLHEYHCGNGNLVLDEETVGISVRVLVGGHWGFSASMILTFDEVVRLAKDAVTQAQKNAKGSEWTVELGRYPVVTGSWNTPIQIDPFTIPIEEKTDCIQYWKQCAASVGVEWANAGSSSWLSFAREERVLATSEGTLVTQTLNESGGAIHTTIRGSHVTQDIQGIAVAGAGWELFLDAKIPEQFLSGQISDAITRKVAIPSKPSALGMYTLICDGATMAMIVESTLGTATQLDRALGYEANAGGTSWIDDPLAMVGTARICDSLVTLTANRSLPKALATVKWDDEGVEPEPFTLIKDGVLVDLQTTREQATWLASYYARHQKPVRSHGCAAAESAHFTPIQQMPNLSLEPNPSAAHLEDLVSSVQDGIFIEEGIIEEMDSQQRTGILTGSMREVKNGRLGSAITGGAVLLNGQQLWKSIHAIGGVTTQRQIGWTPHGWAVRIDGDRFRRQYKGQPPQQTSHTVQAVAAIIGNQPMIDPMRRA